MFAANYYYQTNSNGPQSDLILGDSSFSYSLSHHQGASEETFEKGLTRITVLRRKNNSTMWVEHRTKLGFLTFKYKVSAENWDNTEITFRRYSTYYKGILGAGNNCSAPPAEKNKNDIAELAKNPEKTNFKNLMFDQSCTEKLSPQEFDNLVNATYYILNEDFGATQAPPVMACIGGQEDQSLISKPFSQLRAKVSGLVSNSNSILDIKKDTSNPFPIYCNFDGREKNLCGAAKEGQKTKIDFDARCLKGNSANKEKTIALFMHEFSHTLRLPKSEKEKQLVPLNEGQVQKIDNGICNPKPPDVLFVGIGETDASKNKVIAEENAKSTGAKKLASDVANPYSSFAERATTTTATQTTAVAANDTTSGAIEVGGGSRGSGSSSTSYQQRNIASTSSVNTGAGSSYSVNTSVPTLQQQAQYQNVKTYVDASVGVVAKKIAPIVSYVESPAFAATLPPTSFENGNSGETTASAGTATNAAKSAAVNRGAASTGRSGETASGGSTGSSGEVARSNSADLGSSSSGSSRNPAAVNKSVGRLSSDSGLDNAYALKVRKKLLSDNAYRTELRSKGVQIEFADGYKFETPGHTVLYTEKNGVLVGGK